MDVISGAAVQLYPAEGAKALLALF